MPFAIANAIGYKKEEVPPAPEEVWYEIIIDNSANSNDLTDYQVLLTITGDAQFFSDCNDDDKVIEIYDEDKATLIPFYVEEWDVANKNARIWIKVPLIPANSIKKVYLKVNPSRTESLSNPYNVFIRFDDFEDYNVGDPPSIDKGWEVIDGDPVIVSDGYEGKGLELENTSTRDTVQLNLNGYFRGVVVHFRWKIDGLDLRNGSYNFMEDSTYIVSALKTNGVEKWLDSALNQHDFNPQLNYQVNVWHEYEYIFFENNFKVRKDGVLYEGGIRVAVTQGVNICFWDTYSAGSYVHRYVIDNVYVRKYTEPEPTVTYNKL